MFSHVFKKTSQAIKQWFERIWLPTEPTLIPIKIRHDEFSHHHVHIKRKRRS